MGNVTQFVECLPDMHDVLGSSYSTADCWHMPVILRRQRQGNQEFKDILNSRPAWAT